MHQQLQMNLTSLLSNTRILLTSELNRTSTDPLQIQELLYAKFRSHQDIYDLVISIVIESNNALRVGLDSFKRLSSQLHINSTRFSDIRQAHSDIKEIIIVAIFNIEISFNEAVILLKVVPRQKSKRYSNKSQIIRWRENLNNVNPISKQEVVSKPKQNSSVNSVIPQIKSTKNEPLDKKCSFNKSTTPVLTNYSAMRENIEQTQAKAQKHKKQDKNHQNTATSSKKITVESEQQIYERNSFAKFMEIQDHKATLPASKIEAESDSQSEDAIFEKMQKAVSEKQALGFGPRTQTITKELQPNQKMSQSSLKSWFGKA